MKKNLTMAQILKVRAWSLRIPAIAVAGALGTASVWAADISWDGSGGDDFWSTVGNWSDNADPAGDNITFNNTAAVGTAGTVTNIVDQNYNVGSLVYENFGVDTNYHTTQINSGVTLNVTGLAFNTTTELDTSQTDFTGDGALVYNNGAGIIQLGRAAKQTTTVDMSGLSSFTATADQILLGANVDSSNSGITTLTLAGTNVITANRLQAGGIRQDSALYLGQSNTLNIDELWLGEGERSGGTTINMAFDSGLIDPNVTIRDKAGTGGADLLLAWGKFPSDGFLHTATIDLRGGSVDAQFDTVQMGMGRQGINGNGKSFATFYFDAGSVHMNTAVLGRTNSSSKFGAGQGNIYISGTGTLTVGLLTLGDNIGGADTVEEGGFIYLTDSAIFRATTIQAGATVAGSNHEINFTSGTIGNLSGTDLTIGSDIKLELIGTGSHVFDVEAGQVATINTDITQSGGDAGLTKTGDGTLYLAGGDDTYSGDTLLLDGLFRTDTFLTGDYIFESIMATFQVNEAALTVGGAQALFGTQIFNNTGGGTLEAVDVGDYTQISIVPEPSSVALIFGLFASLTLLGRRQRRRL
ncbi:PEP-CTERM sorting domain-containing protein [Puniceicoccus vermicola]|uniref:PEP-CTERM sorting domain-containing protein n=1 Tax=Puniceicoccus vermicola TaxID=388746 RepID=A0A7X1B060_9BACT|nr:PEP-CTERM sorting domain-containing protein [Puniceicoccus vermicola]MBC2603181.1 PEP-CTERM sorting domain-containing protein [Puniceicoccus vermicola]